MSAPNRLYLVSNNQTQDSVLVEAHHPAAAIKTMASDLFSVSVPTALEAAVLVRDGMTVIRAPKPETVAVEAPAEAAAA